MTDPFAGSESTPSISFKDAPAGTTFVLDVTGPATPVQTIDWITKLPAFWPPNADGTPGNPKMAAVVPVELNGEAHSLWAPITSKKDTTGMFAALKDAQIKAGKRFEAGGRLTVKLVGFTPSTKGNDKKNYQAVYEGPDPFGAPAGQPAQQQTPAAAPQQPTTPTAAPADPLARAAAIKQQITGLQAIGLGLDQVVKQPGVVGLDGLPMTAATAAAILALP